MITRRAAAPPQPPAPRAKGTGARARSQPEWFLLDNGLVSDPLQAVAGKPVSGGQCALVTQEGWFRQTRKWPGRWAGTPIFAEKAEAGKRLTTGTGHSLRAFYDVTVTGHVPPEVTITPRQPPGPAAPGTGR